MTALRLIFLILSFIGLSSSLALAQEATRTGEQAATENRRHFLGSSAFMLFNLLPDPPSFYQLNYGYRLTPKDVLIVEAITWTYHAPLGVPYGPKYGSASEDYPGSIREYGVGLSYQRFIWGNLYAGVHATPFLRHYLDPAKKKIQNGFQLFLALRFGYHLGWFDDRVFIEPSVAFTHWPITTNVPKSFAALDRRWPNYFLFEPGLHFGVNF